MKLRRTTQKSEFLWGGVISASEGEGCNFSPEGGCKFRAPARVCPLYTPPMLTCRYVTIFQNLPKRAKANCAWLIVAMVMIYGSDIYANVIIRTIHNMEETLISHTFCHYQTVGPYQITSYICSDICTIYIVQRYF